jgi:hypothetical protein
LIGCRVRTSYCEDNEITRRRHARIQPNLRQNLLPKLPSQILLTGLHATKRGIQGPGRINFSMYSGVQEVKRRGSRVG